MKVKIGGLELSDVTLDELDELVRRYGNGHAKPDTTPKPMAISNAAAPMNGSTTDVLVAQKFVDAGMEGVMSTTLGTLLGRQGKATRRAVRDWAKRIGINSEDPIEDCRTNGTARGIRLRSDLLGFAKSFVEQRRKQ